MPLTIVRDYHDATKHHFNRFARSLGYLDWATQPDPFRRYDGAPIVELWRGQPAPFAYDALFDPVTASPGPDARVTLERVSLLLRYSMGLSAWKQYGRSRWALRVNPSSGNLHPTESYVISRPLDVAAPGSCVYHYAPDRHVFERRAAHDQDLLTAIGVSAADSVIVGLSSVHWREAWKYGERAFRYCQHDTGHAIAAIVLAARMLGWSARLVPGVSMQAVASLLGLDRDARVADAEREEPECLLVLGSDLDAIDESRIAGPGRWMGVANELSRDHVEWPIIDEIAAATRAPATVGSRQSAVGSRQQAVRRGPPSAFAEASADRSGRPTVDASRIMLQRRSALALDGHSSIDRDAFVRMLMRVVPSNAPPWDAIWWPPRVHLALFVHRVDGLEPGLYFLIRNPASEDLVRNALQREFSWTRVDGVPDALMLFRLASGDCRRLAGRLSCDQEIAADGFFSLGMIAELEPALEAHGPWFYRQLFWETGIIGQVLYLEAEAAGARSTGIGCFYDDPVHDTLGIFSHALQSLYHFTVGMPVEDPRLTTEPGYEWEAGHV